MIHPLRIRVLTALAFVAVAFPTLAQECAPVPREGARCFFAGNSFFVPISGMFNALAMNGDHPSHTFDFDFTSGIAGSPEQLWDNADGSRTRVVQSLSDGVDIFGLTVSHRDLDRFTTYTRWIDEAIAINPDIRVFIGHPWVSSGPSYSNAAAFRAAVEAEADAFVPILASLRAQYPKTRIEYVNYALMAAVLWERFEMGELTEIGCVSPAANGQSTCADGSTALFRDNGIGHGGELMESLSGVLWYPVLYDGDVSTLDLSASPSDLMGMVNEVLEFNAAFPQPPQDWNDDGNCDFFDVVDYLRDLDASVPGADLNADGVFTSADKQILLNSIE